jgi:pimeloyl-ACP methyl ester carboxylesterase
MWMMLVLPGPLLAQATREGGYVVMQGGQEIVRERYRFDGRRLESTLVVPAQSIVLEGATEYDGSLTPVRYHAALHALGDTVIRQTLTATFGPDSVRWEISGAGAPSGATAITPPFQVFRNLSFAHLAIAILDASTAPGGRKTFSAWVPDGAAVIPLAIAVMGDTGTLTLSGIPMRFEMERGWPTRVEVPAQGVTVEWRAEVDPGMPPADTAGPRPPETVRESAFAFASGEVGLDGTLTVPAEGVGPWPVGLIVAGSGPTDRNGNSGMGLKTNTYAQLAWRLAERGIATVRYDKRGLGASRASFDPSQVTFDDFAGDVAAGVRALRADSRFGPVLVIGHSEGAGLAIRAAEMGAPVSGLALVAGMGRDFTTVLRGQLAEQLDDSTMAAFDRAWAQYLAGEEVGQVPDAVRVLFAPVNRRFVQTAVAFDAARALAKLKLPVLILQGETDFQVSVADARLLHAAKPDAELVILPAVNHTLKAAPVRDRVAQAGTYLDPSVPVAPEVVAAIARWVETMR